MADTQDPKNIKRPNKSPAGTPPPPVRPPTEAPWRPDWKWHAKVLGGIYVILIVAYFALNALLSRLPAPYGLRHIPQDLTPWLKK